MRNDFVAFRVPTEMKSRLCAVADAEYLTASDIVRRATFASIRELEEKHSLATPRPAVAQKSAWILASR